jgi:predicted 3-demethylubiquinone-9 3-methyltransferase (glyoxalase superfamily)
VLTVEFTVMGIPCLGLNGGPTFKHTEAFSFQIATDNQEETDRYWNAISSAMVERKAHEVGARTAGAFLGRSPRAR